MSEIVFERTDERLGEFAVRPVDPDRDTELLHGWLTHPKSAYWLMLDAEPADVRRQFRTIEATPGNDAFVGLHNGVPAFLIERYDPARSELAELYRAERGDVGMHFLAAPTGMPVHGFTRAVLTTVMDLMFADPGVRRVVVEPDVNNTSVHALNAEVGFEVIDTVSLTEKKALLSVCTRAAYLASGKAGSTEREVSR
ncbi:N-acetyltransferase [Actinopolyspora erythraea]|uniref:Lysine N-acyltransferase MbtK n=1 Tax=Actinopolyspora erythraea TaxID=414996 RepID=A0A099DA89_9ACTN|nr:GNAT family N-acetyltransferase [Actinopolyspora erythraea]ASU80508.1 N-acetyltransferase [Actinopolyspora erythraea]KGI82821.1 acetyltransferase [Actinopolyspora erythraea]